MQSAKVDVKCCDGAPSKPLELAWIYAASIRLLLSVNSSGAAH